MCIRDRNTYDSLSMPQFTKLEIKGLDSLHQMFYKQVFYYDDDHYLFAKEDAFYKVNYKTRAFEQKYDFAHSTLLTKMEGDSLMVFDRESGEVKIIDLATSTVTYPFRNLTDHYQIPAKTTFSFAEKIKDQQYILTSRPSGVFIYDHRARKIYNHQHHYADPSSISANVTTTLEVHPSGWVFITCNPAGISYFNSHEIINNQEVFLDQHGNGYDGYVAGIATTDNQTYYIGTGEGLLEWNRNTNITHFINFKDKEGLPLPSPQEIISIVIDNKDHIWATTNTQGLIVFDKHRKLVRHMTHTGDRKFALKMERANRLVIGPDDFVWACGKNGICRINPATFEVDHLEKSILSNFDSTYCTLLEFTDKDNLWIAISSGGVTHCNLATNELRSYTMKEGLIHNGIFSLGSDHDHNMYVGTRAGLNIIFTDGRIKTLTQKDGLLMNRAEGLSLDQHNRMWIGNDIGLACYTPEDSSLTTFDTRHGLSIYGFRVGSYFKMPNGCLLYTSPSPRDRTRSRMPSSA